MEHDISKPNRLILNFDKTVTPELRERFLRELEEAAKNCGGLIVWDKEEMKDE